MSLYSDVIIIKSHQLIRSDCSPSLSSLYGYFPLYLLPLCMHACAKSLSHV